MRHEKMSFGRRRPQDVGEGAGWQLRAELEHRRQARQAAIEAAAGAIASAIGTALAMLHGSCGGAAILAIAATAFLMIGIVAASEA